VRLGYYVDLSDFPDGLGGQVQVRISTRWEDLGLDNPVPRELWMAIRSTAPGASLNEGASEFCSFLPATPLTPSIQGWLLGNTNDWGT